jgi:hypothetical protein
MQETFMSQPNLEVRSSSKRKKQSGADDNIETHDPLEASNSSILPHCFKVP